MKVQRRFMMMVVLVFSAWSGNAVAVGDLHAEIERLMLNLGWHQMVRVSLERGDVQKIAKAKLPPEAWQCVDSKYTERRVLDEIAAGYAEVYSEPNIVSTTADFVAKPGAKRILAAVADRAPAVGASAAYQEVRGPALATLTPEERQELREFDQSDAGRTYVEVSAKQLRVHHDRLEGLATSIANECSH